jgi:hypothetical protein
MNLQESQSRFKQDGQDRQDEEERMKAARMNAEWKAACHLFRTLHSAFRIALYPVYPVHPVNFFLSAARFKYCQQARKLKA